MGKRYLVVFSDGVGDPPRIPARLGEELWYGVHGYRSAVKVVTTDIDAVVDYFNSLFDGYYEFVLRTQEL